MSSIDRKPHRLRREKTLAIPRHVIFCDTETKEHPLPDGSTGQRLQLGWACYLRCRPERRTEQQDWLEFTAVEDFWRFVLDRSGSKNRLWVIAHNLSFDFTVVEGFRVLRAAGYTCSFFYAKGMTTLIKVKKKGCSIIFVDSLNWFKESLQQLGERLGVPKLKIDFATADLSYLSTYCKRDVEILVEAFKALVKFLQGNKISRLCYTIGSTSMSAFLLGHYQGDIYIHNNSEAIDLERAAYCGGRTECFFLGVLDNGPYYLLDVNSLYSFVMRDNWFPVKYETLVRKLSPSALQDLLTDHTGVADVWVNTPEPVYAVKRDRTIFPTGSFRVCLSGPELIYALDHDHIREVFTAVIYQRARLFTDFVDRFYALRLEFKSAGVELFDHFCKLILNSLYGKFGQKGETWHKIGLAPNEPDRVEDIIDATSHRRRQLRYLLGEVFELVGFGETRDSFPAIAAHVTAYARLYLYRLMGICGEGNYFYCDTDSLFVNESGLKNLEGFLHPTRLGGLKIESTTETMSIFGLKDYITDSGTVIKGIRKNAEQLLPGVYRQERWPSLQGMLRTGETSMYRIGNQVKELNRRYVKAEIAEDGWTIPFVLGDSDLPF